MQHSKSSKTEQSLEELEINETRLNSWQEKNQNAPEQQPSEDEDSEARASETPQANIPRKSQLVDILTTLASEAPTIVEGDRLIKNFLDWGFGFIDEKSFTRIINRYTKEKYSAKLLRAATRLVEDIVYGHFLDCYLEHIIYNVPWEKVVADNLESESHYNKYYQELEFVLQHFNIDRPLDGCLYGEEDLDENIIVRHVPGAGLIKTDSKFGRALEDLLKSFGRPLYYQRVRKAYCAFAIGQISKDQFRDELRSFVRFFADYKVQKLEKQFTEELFDMANIYVVYKTDPEVICTHVGRVTLDDFEYLDNVLDLKSLEVGDLINGESVEPIVELEPFDETKHTILGQPLTDSDKEKEEE